MNDDDQRLVADTARRALAETLSLPDEAKLRRAAWQALERAELLEVALLEPHGANSLTTAATVLRACVEGLHPLPYAETAMIAGPMMANAGFPVPAGPLTAAVANDARLVRAGDALRVRAHAARVPWASVVAQLVLVSEHDEHEVMMVIDPSRVHIRPGRNVADEHRDDVEVDAEIPAGRWTSLPVGAGRELELRGALARAIALSMAADQALARMLRYVGERVQFGRPIGRFQAVQHAVVEVAAEAAIVRASADAALAAAAEDGFAADSTQLAIAVAKTQASLAAGTIARIAHQLHGAMGTTREHDLHRITTRLWSWRDEFGSETQWSRWLTRATRHADPWEVITR